MLQTLTVCMDHLNKYTHSFEIFVTEDILLFSAWNRLLEKIAVYDKDFMVEILFNSNTVAFFLYAQKDLSLLATKLEGFILKPMEKQDLHRRSDSKKVAFKLSLNKNILEIREREELQKQRIISRVLVNVKKIFKFFIYNTTVIFDTEGQACYSSYTTITNPLASFEFDFKNTVKFKKKTAPVFLKIDSSVKMFTQRKEEAFLDVFGFPYFSHEVYFPLTSFDFAKHSLIVGQTGVGKSKFIELFVREIEKKDLQDKYAIVIVDPHASLASQFNSLKSAKIVFDFIQASCELFPNFSEPKIATELTILLFKTLLKDQFNAKMERTLKYALYVLFLANTMSLYNLKRFLTELEFRKEILTSFGKDYDYLSHFFETEYVELQTKFYDLAIMPILVLIDELQFIPVFSGNTAESLENVLQNNFLTCFSLNRIYLGEKATRLIAGLIIQQLFLIAQRKSVNKKIILIIDEVSIVENESLVQILSEARKFNLSLFLSQQYLTQISPDLLKGILSNVYNYFVFKMSDEDAKIIAKNLDIVFPDEMLIKQKEKGFSDEDLKRNLLVNLNPRECLVRVFGNGKFYECFKAKTKEATKE